MRSLVERSEVGQRQDTMHTDEARRISFVSLSSNTPSPATVPNRITKVILK